jgi:hypothetical protein
MFVAFYPSGISGGTVVKNIRKRIGRTLGRYVII